MIRPRAGASRFLLSALVALLPTAAPAAPYAGQPLDAYAGPVLGDSRVLGLAGAFAGVGEGLGGVPSNPAAVAQRSLRLDRTWDVGGSLTWFVPQAADLGSLDLGNDGHPDSGFTGRGNIQLGVSGQAGRLGGGIIGRAWEVEVARPSGDALVLSTGEVSLALGWSALADSLVVGVSVTETQGQLKLVSGKLVEQQLDYLATSLRAGALWRPRGQPFRIGASLAPAARALPRSDRAAFPATTPESFLFPWTLSLGASTWIGPNARRYNEPPPIALDRHPEWGEGPPYQAGARDPVLVSAQLDVVGPVAPGAVGIDGALGGGDALPSGRYASLVPRFGAEWEAWHHWLRVRGGSYLEPSRTGASPRAHATFGLEGRIPFWPWDLQLSITGDVAHRYENVSLSLWFWSEYGPAAPPPPDAPESAAP